MDEYGWLIERQKLPEEEGVKWLQVEDNGNFIFTAESHLALRFSRKEDADGTITVLSRILGKCALDGLYSTDHIWPE